MIIEDASTRYFFFLFLQSADCIADLIMFGRVGAPVSCGSLLALPSQYHGLVIRKQLRIGCLQTVDSLGSYAASLQITLITDGVFDPRLDVIHFWEEHLSAVLNRLAQDDQ